MVIKRRTDRWDKTPLTWFPIRYGKDGGGTGLTASVNCVNGHGAALYDHAISVDGKVDPSLVCEVGSCGWHEFVTLEGWTTPAREPGEGKGEG